MRCEWIKTFVLQMNLEILDKGNFLYILVRPYLMTLLPAGPNLKVISTMSVGYGGTFDFIFITKRVLSTWTLYHRAR